MPDMMPSKYDDMLYGDEMDNLIWGGRGDDTLRGMGGDDTLIGGPGADALDGGDGIDTADYSQTKNRGVNVYLDRADTEQPDTGSIGDDAHGDDFSSIENVIGSKFNDMIVGDGGMNMLSGGQGNDNIMGNAGADSLYGGMGHDTIMGGAADDMAMGGMGQDMLSGDAGADHLAGNMGDDTIYGGGMMADGTEQTGTGKDTLWVGMGDDELMGQDGDDVLVGGMGADTLKGGAGSKDVANYQASDDEVNVNLTLTSTGAVRTQKGGHAEGDKIEGIEWVHGSMHDDTLIGIDGRTGTVDNDGYISGANKLVGHMGDDHIMGGDEHEADEVTDDPSTTDFDESSNKPTGDTLFGGQGDDTLNGQGGHDMIKGGADNDELMGGSGNDTLNGGMGNDTLDGGAVADGGDDVYVFDMYEKDAANVIMNWSDNDRIDLSDMDLVGISIRAGADAPNTAPDADVQIVTGTNTSTITIDKMTITVDTVLEVTDILGVAGLA